MKYYIAVYQKLKEIYKSQSSLQNDISLICPSLVMYEKDDLQLLNPDFIENDKSKTGKSYRKKADVAYQLNTVPVSSNFWDINPANALPDIYENILNEVELPNLNKRIDAELAESGAELWDGTGKETKAFKSYQKFLTNYERKLEEIHEHLQSYHEAETEEEESSWQEKLQFLTKQKQLALLELDVKGFKATIEKALSKRNRNSKEDRFYTLVEEAKSEFLASKETDTMTRNDLYSIGFIPYDFMDSEKGWTSIKFSKTELDNLYDTAKTSSEGLPPQVISIDYDDASIEGIELDYQFIHLKRRWFYKSLFHDEHFSVKKEVKVSDGQTISNEYMLPAFPKVMMLIKNLKIILAKSITEEQVANPGMMINFGPLFLKQQLFLNKSTSEKFLKAVTNKYTIKSDQLNYQLRKSVKEASEAKLSTSGSEAKPVTVEKPVLQGGFPGLKTMKLEKPISTTVSTKSAAAVSSAFGKQMNKPVLGTLIIHPGLFSPVPIPLPPKTANVTFYFTDKVNLQPLYKCSISIRGTDNSWFFEKETDEIGQLTTSIPPGSYSIEYRLDGYQNNTVKIKIDNTNPAVFRYQLEREEIKFTSYFLIGMVCEKLPAIPQQNK